MARRTAPGPASALSREPLRLIAALLGLLAALLVGHFVVYRGLIVPRLPMLRAVPGWMWLLQFTPELVTCIAAGRGLRRWKWAMTYAVSAAALRVAFIFVLAQVHAPGFKKAFEAPVEDAALLLCFFTAIYSALFGLVAWVISRRTPPHLSETGFMEP